MNNRRQQQLHKAVNPLLTGGEQVELTGIAKVGSVSTRRKILTAAVVGILSAGTVMATVQPRPMYWVLTDRRLLFFDGRTASGKPGKLLMTIPRELITAAPLSKALLGLGLKTLLTIQGQEKGLKLLFPTVARADGRDLAARIPVSL